MAHSITGRYSLTTFNVTHVRLAHLLPPVFFSTRLATGCSSSTMMEQRRKIGQLASTKGSAACIATMIRQSLLARQPNPIRHCHVQPLALILVALLVTLANSFLVPVPPSPCSPFLGVSTHFPSSASSRPSTTALPARYTSKDTGDRKKKARIRGFKSAKAGGASKRPGMTEEEKDYFDR